jgi:hypothetical protein
MSHALFGAANNDVHKWQPMRLILARGFGRD